MTHRSTDHTSQQTVGVRGMSRAVHQDRQLLPPVSRHERKEFIFKGLNFTLSADPATLARQETCERQFVTTIGETTVRVTVSIEPSTSPETPVQ